MTDARCCKGRRPVREERVAGARAHDAIPQNAPALRIHALLLVQFAGPSKSRGVAGGLSSSDTPPQRWFTVTHYLCTGTLAERQLPVRRLHTAPA